MVSQKHTSILFVLAKKLDEVGERYDPMILTLGINTTLFII